MKPHCALSLILLGSTAHGSRKAAAVSPDSADWLWQDPAAFRNTRHGRVDKRRPILPAWSSRFVTYGLGSFLVHKLGRLKVEGADNIPAGPAVFAAGHQAYADILALGAVFDRGPGWLGKIELYRRSKSARLMRYHGVLPVNRDSSQRDTELDLAVRRLLREERRQLVVFPQGTRKPDVNVWEEPSLRRGAALWALVEGVPLVPVILVNTPGFQRWLGQWYAHPLRAMMAPRTEDTLPRVYIGKPLRWEYEPTMGRAELSNVQSAQKDMDAEARREATAYTAALLTALQDMALEYRLESGSVSTTE